MNEGTANSMDELITQLLEAMPVEHIYELAEKNIDLLSLASSDPSPHEVLANYAIGGFIAGIKFAVQNITVNPNETEAAE